MNRLAVRRLADSLLLAASLVLAACSGAVSGPASSTGPILISPSTAVLYSDLPTTFLISGGNGNYLITSSDQSALPVATTLSGHSLTVVPGTVGADTPVTLNVRDSAGSLAANAQITVKPRTVSNVVTITPSGTSCGNAICAGGDAQVQVVLAQAGVPIANRTVRFDVVSGDLRIYAADDALATSGVAVTDANGNATVRVRALDNAATQTALLDIVDTGSGATVRTGVPISSGSIATLSAQPSSLAFQGTSSTTCANGVSADILISGGKSPYTVSQPASFAMSASIVTSNPGRVTVTPKGQCTSGDTIVILDANGASATVNATNSVGTVVPSNFTVAPETVTLSTCEQVASVQLAGGSGFYYGAAGADFLEVNSPGGFQTGTIGRRRGTNPAGATSGSVAFSDGQVSKTVTVTLVGLAKGQC